MNIDWVLVCRYVEVHDNLGTIVGAGIDAVWVPDIPAPIQVLLAVRLMGLPEELTIDQKHSVVSRVRDPQDQIVGEVGGDLSVEARSARPDWLAGIIVPAVIRFEVAKEGTHTVEQSVDAASYAVPIHIVRGLPSNTD